MVRFVWSLLSRTTDDGRRVSPNVVAIHTELENLQPGLTEKARTPLELNFAARDLAKNMFAVLD
jgi:hypothetical protein